MAKKHPLSQRHFKQIVCRSAHQRKQQFPIWAITWRPGGKSSSFLNNLFRPIGSPTMMVQVSHAVGRDREAIALFGIAAQVDPQAAVVSYSELRLKHDFHHVPFVGARGAILDPSDDGSTRSANSSWVRLGLKVDALRQRAARCNNRLPEIPQLPTIYHGYGRKEGARFEVTLALRLKAACELAMEWTADSLSDLASVKAEVLLEQLRRFDALSEEQRLQLLMAAWESAFIAPEAPGNSTGLWLLPHEYTTDVYRATRIFEYFGDLVGVHLFNPASILGGKAVPNPALQLAQEAGMDLVTDLNLLAQTHAGSDDAVQIEARLLGLIPAYRKAISASQELSDEDLLHAVCAYDSPVLTAPQLASLRECEQLRVMREALKPQISACCADSDLLEAARNPHSPLFARGLCRVQTLHRNVYVPLERALCFGTEELGQERVEARLWHGVWSHRRISRAVESQELALAA